MADPRTVIPVVMGVGLTVLTTRGGRRSGNREVGRHEPLFILATQLVGFAVVGVALFIAAWSAENGRALGPGDLKAENLLIVALGAMIAIVAVRNALVGFVDAATACPWERGLLERWSTVLLMVIAVLVAALLGMSLDELLLHTAKMRVGRAVPVVTLLLIGALTATFLLLRFMLKSSGSPEAFAMSRREQRRMWTALEGADGTWTTISIQPASVVRPNDVFTAIVWEVARGWCLRAEDAYALARYHAWMGNHLAVPNPAFHLHRVSVFAGVMPSAMRGMRVTATTRRLWWLDAWRSHRSVPALDMEPGSPERRAGLVLITADDLRCAGLAVTCEASVEAGGRSGKFLA